MYPLRAIVTIVLGKLWHARFSIDNIGLTLRNHSYHRTIDLSLSIGGVVVVVGCGVCVCLSIPPLYIFIIIYGSMVRVV